MQEKCLKDSIYKFMKTFISFILIIFLPIKALALIEVDITRGNLNPLPIAVSPLSIDENSRKILKKYLKKILVQKFLSS